jgi:hypothetical protein
MAEEIGGREPAPALEFAEERGGKELPDGGGPFLDASAYKKYKNIKLICVEFFLKKS